MFQPKVVTLSEAHVHIRAHGPAEFLPQDFSNVTRHGENIIWDPGVDGILGGESSLTESSDHAGERHLDADEVLYLISGAMRLSLELDDGSTVEVPLSQGQAVIVPQRVWHRLIVDEPIRLLFFGGGRTELRHSV
jgi:mannose-6-phosphate isomerase-like protein (cupin superfamily)